MPAAADAQETADSHVPAGVRPVVPETAEEAAVAQVAESSSYVLLSLTPRLPIVTGGQLIFLIAWCVCQHTMI